MGLLDDAIRDHIDLLRRRGADPTEIAQAEADALGPVVREVAHPEHHSEDDDLLAGTEAAPAPLVDEFDDEPDDDGLPFEEDDDFREASAAPEYIDQPTQHFQTIPAEDAEAEVALEEDDFEDPSLRAPETAAAPDLEDDADPFAEDLPAATGDEPARDASGDVLEGTPDFLAESPDHERLWFEQAPPKDFNFEDDD